MNKQHFILLLLPLLLLYSCEKVISIETVNTPHKLVINAANQPSSSWQVHLSSSANLTDTVRPNFYEEALVVLRDETSNTTDTLNYLSMGNYGSIKKPIADHIYSVTASGDGYPTATAHCKIPLSPQLDSVTTTWGIYLNDSTLISDLSLLDDSAPDNFYLISATARIYPNTTAEENVNAKLYTLDKNTDNSEIGDEATPFNFLYLSDQKFNVQNYTTQFYVDVHEYRRQNIPFCVEFRLQSVSEGLFLHLKSYQQYLDDNVNVNFNLPLQVQVYSNVANGFGIFSAYSGQIQEICF